MFSSLFWRDHNGNATATLLFCVIPTIAPYIDYIKIRVENYVTATGLEPTTTYIINEHSTIQPNWRDWQNGWVFLYEISGCRFECSCSHLNFRFRACFEQEVPWHSGNYRVRIHSERRMWHDNNIQLITLLFVYFFRNHFNLVTARLWSDF